MKSRGKGQWETPQQSQREQSHPRIAEIYRSVSIAAGATRYWQRGGGPRFCGRLRQTNGQYHRCRKNNCWPRARPRPIIAGCGNQSSPVDAPRNTLLPLTAGFFSPGIYHRLVTRNAFCALLRARFRPEPLPFYHGLATRWIVPGKRGLFSSLRGRATMGK